MERELEFTCIFHYKIHKKIAVRIYTSGSQPVGCNPFVISHKITHISDIYITAPNSSKIAVMKEQRNSFLVKSHHNMRECQ